MEKFNQRFYNSNRKSSFPSTDRLLCVIPEVKSRGFLMTFHYQAGIHWNKMTFLQDHGATHSCIFLFGSFARSCIVIQHNCFLS